MRIIAICVITIAIPHGLRIAQLRVPPPNSRPLMRSEWRRVCRRHSAMIMQFSGHKAPQRAPLPPSAILDFPNARVARSAMADPQLNGMVGEPLAPIAMRHPTLASPIAGRVNGHRLHKSPIAPAVLHHPICHSVPCAHALERLVCPNAKSRSPSIHQCDPPSFGLVYGPPKFQKKIIWQPIRVRDFTYIGTPLSCTDADEYSQYSYGHLSHSYDRLSHRCILWMHDHGYTAHHELQTT